MDAAAYIGDVSNNSSEGRRKKICRADGWDFRWWMGWRLSDPIGLVMVSGLAEGELFFLA